MPVTSAFFAEVKKPFGSNAASLFYALSQQQVDAMNAIVSVFDAFIGHDHCTDDLAYILATCYRECGSPLNLAIEEVGKGNGKAYGVPTGPYNKRYYGRGPCQVTWLANYQKAKVATGIDFVQFPEYMCVPSKGVVYMIDAMYNGRFTQYSLRNFITPGKPTTYDAFYQCRKIINGTDHAAEVANNALAFAHALKAGYILPATAVLVPKPAGSGFFAMFTGWLHRSK